MRVKTLYAGLLLGSLFGSFLTHAIPSTDLKAKYEPIIARNPFGLKPPAPPPTNAPPPKVEENKKTEIFLTGIASVGAPKYPKKAFLILREQGSKKDTNYLSLKEGDKANGIEVLAINEKDRTVRIASADLGEMLLSFKTHGLTNPIAPMQPVMARPGMPGAPGAIPPPPGTHPNFQAGIQPGAPPPLTAPGDMNPQPGGYAPSIPAGTRTIPSRSPRGQFGAPVQGGGFPGGGTEAAAHQQEPEVDGAQQYINLRAREEMARRQGMAFPPTPPPPGMNP